MATAPKKRKLVKDLNNHPLVESATLSHAAIIVKFKNGIRERWCTKLSDASERWRLFYMPKDFGAIGDKVQIGREYQFNSLDDEYEEFKPFFLIRKSHYLKASFVAQRMMIHTLIDRILQNGWIEIRYPRNILIDDFKNLKNDRLGRFNWGRSLRIHGCYGNSRSKTYGRYILEHFLDLGDLGKRTFSETWSDPGCLYIAIRKVMKYKRDITRTSILREMNTANNKSRSGPRFIHPNFYRAIFRRFKISGCKLADPSPGDGSKALAAMSEGISYYYGEDIFSRYVKDITKFLGVDASPIDGSRYDVAFLDFGWKPAPNLVEELCKWREQADQVLLYVPRSMKDEVDLDPVDVHEVEVGLLRTSEPDFLFLV